MSSVANATMPTAGTMLMGSQSISPSAEKLDEDVPKSNCAKNSESESDSESETSSEEEDTSDDDKRMADNPILKERLKQLDRYATPLSHKTQSPDQTALSGTYTTPLPLTECMVNSGPLSSHGKSSGPSDLVDSSSTPSEYRSHQPSVTESPNPCSGPASLNTSVTPKHNFSPPYGIHGVSGGASGPSSQHEQTGVAFYSQISSKFSRKSHEGAACGYTGSYPGGCEPNAPGEQLGDGESEQEFTCEVCSAVYANRSSLRSHMKKHINHVAKRHQCDQCPYSTQYGKNLVKHIESMHGKNQADQIQCEGCSRFFPTEDRLRDHECISVQYNAYRCDECGRVFKTKLRLKYHADIHNPRKPYVCDVDGCDRAFRTPKYLKNHRDEFHRMQPKNYLCPVEGCDLVFHRKTHLKRHIATHEDAEKKYHCQWPNCQRRFCSEETLNLHYRKHTGEKPFNCALCAYTCYNKPTLNEHYRLNHAKDSTVEGPYKSFNHPVSPPAAGSQRTSVQSYNFNSQREGESTNVHSSTPTVAPTVRHRMADILESCGTQPPGPLDAEINGILDSLDKESDLPDLFTSSNFDFEPNGSDATYRNPSHAAATNLPPRGYEHPAAPSSGHEARYSSTASPAVSSEHPRLSSLETTLASILADFQKADLNNSVEEFEEAKSKALSVLPTFTIGDSLDQQLTTVLEEVLESFMEQPPQVLRAVFQAARPFTREESYMIESLEHQLMDDTALVAPTPPRRRGRRPKLQQQLQPYLQRVFDLEPGTAEAMAAHLVSTAQQERNVSFYTPYPAAECVRGRGRGRGCRIRGRSGRPLSLTLKLFPDGTASRTYHPGPTGYRRAIGGAMHRGAGIPRRMRGGIRGRYRIDRLTGSGFQHSNTVCENSLDAQSPVNELPPESNPPHRIHQRTYNEPRCFNSEDQEPNYPKHPHHHHDRFESDAPVQSEEIDTTSMRLRAIRKSSAESDEELDDLDEMDEAVEDDTGENYEEKELAPHAHAHRMDATMRRSAGLNVAELSKVVAQKSGLYSSADKGSVNQDTLGEMLEDLGVIVKRIGERAAARRQPCAQDSSPVYSTQPLNLAELPEDEQPADCSVASLLLNGSKLARNRGDATAPAIQLPSMAILASASVGTPTSTCDGSTPGCLSNAEPQGTSPNFNGNKSQHSASVTGPYGPIQSHTPLMPIHPENLTAAAGAGVHSTPLGNAPLRNEFKTSQSDYHHRSIPMWSCESMCCPTTRDNCSAGPDKSGYSRSPSCDESVHRMSVPRSAEENGDNGQSYCPTDLSTRMVIGYDDQSISPQGSPSSPKRQRGSMSPVCVTDVNGISNKSDLLPPYSVPLSSNAAAMDSLRSAVEAVDHLRSLSALGAKYTASLGGADDPKLAQSYPQSLRIPGYQYAGRSVQPDESPQPASVGRPEPGPSPTPPPHGSSQNLPGPNIFTPPHMPSALNNLLSRDQKPENLMASPLGLSVGGGANGPCTSPSKGDFPVQTTPGSVSALGGYSPYHPSSLSSRCSSRGRNETSFHSLGLPAPASVCSSASSSSSSARSYLQDVYQQQQQQQQHQQQQRELQYHQLHHHHQQQQQQQQIPPQSGFPHHNSKSSVHELTTRQLLSEAAATAYAHGLGRCESQGFMGGNNQAHSLDIASPRGNPYAHPSSAGFANPYSRYPSVAENSSYGHAHTHPEPSSTEHGFHSTHLSGAEFGSPSHGATSTTSSHSSGNNSGAQYMGHGVSDPYQLYPPHLRQTSSHMHHALSRSMDQQQHQPPPPPPHMQPQSAAAAAHLAHSIHEVSGLAAAYHAYHQYHQQQAVRHGLGVPPPTSPAPGAHAHYHNLLNAQSRGYYPGPGADDQFSAHRELGLYTAHTERRDPKSAYLAETYRESQATSGRFLF